jgi:hypothetical protein
MPPFGLGCCGGWLTAGDYLFIAAIPKRETSASAVRWESGQIAEEHFFSLIT